MQKAIEALDAFIQSKTNHSTASITDEMKRICYEIPFPTDEEAQDFMQRCSNFDKYCTMIGKMSWGRKQFEAWWNAGEAQFASQVFPEDSGKLKGAELEEDALSDDFFPPFRGVKPEVCVYVPKTHPHAFSDIHAANTYIQFLENENERLRKENERMQNVLIKIRNISTEELH